MTFDELLRTIVDGCGGRGAALMGPDGIPIAQVAARGHDESEADQAAVLGVEFGRILDEMRKASDAVEAGAVEEVTVALSERLVVLRRIDAETTLVLTLPPMGNAGKARYLVRRHLLDLRDQL